jgi:hypothetical protein
MKKGSVIITIFASLSISKIVFGEIISSNPKIAAIIATINIKIIICILTAFDICLN